MTRLPALVALLVLGGLLAAVVVATTPWRPLPGRAQTTQADPRRDFTPEQIAREKAFHRDLRPVSYAGLAAGLIAAGVLGLTPLGARLAVGGGWAVRASVAVAAVLGIGLLVRLPFRIHGETVLRRYGLSTQTWGSWTVDLLKGFGVSLVVSLVAVLAFYALARHAPRTWWMWTGLAGAALTVALSFAYPVLVEPIFNRFTPMPAGALREELLDLARRDGIPVKDVLVADASRRTTALNAYVSGIGSTRRIVVYDTLVERATADEVKLVVAHELGHVAEHDVRDGTLLGALGVATTMALLYLVLSWSPLLRRAGVEGAADPRGVALLAFLVAVATFVAGPLQNLVSRRVEARADVHSLDLTGDAETFVDVEKRLAVTNLSDLDPHPLVYLLFFSHPSAPERIALARDWAAAR